MLLMLSNAADDRGGGLHGSRLRVPRWGAHGVSHNFHQPHFPPLHLCKQVNAFSIFADHTYTVSLCVSEFVGFKLFKFLESNANQRGPKLKTGSKSRAKCQRARFSELQA